MEEFAVDHYAVDQGLTQYALLMKICVTHKLALSSTFKLALSLTYYNLALSLTYTLALAILNRNFFKHAKFKIVRNSKLLMTF